MVVREAAMRIELNRQADISRYLGSGWARPEDGFVWAVGRESWLLLPLATTAKAYFFLITAWPHVRPGRLEAQRVSVDVNGTRVGEFAFRQRATFAGMIDVRIGGNKAAMCIRLSHPDSARPMDFPEDGNADDRPLALAYEAIVVDELAEDEAALTASLTAALDNERAPPARDDEAVGAGFLKYFQSAGNDCEFAFLQREQGLEPIGLLRFASITIDELVRGLNQGFAGIAAPDRMEVFVPENAQNHDYMVREGNYGLVYHTHIDPQSIAADALKAKEVVRLRRLAELFLEDVAYGDHIFVVKYKDPPAPVQLARLMAAFRRLGSATLLWIREDARPDWAGRAAWLLPGLLVGYVDRIDIPPLRNISSASWLSACHAAYGLWVDWRDEM
jgi:hypothetical protein